MRFLGRFVFLISLFFLGCGASPDSGVALQAWNPGDYQQVISTDGTLREYLLHIPPGYDGSRALPLVLVFHGHGGTAEGMAKLSGMNAKADQENFIVAYPQGSGSPTLWNAFSSPDLTVDDVAFVREVLKQLEAQLIVDKKRVYAAGFSNGGMMSHRLGAELSDTLAGVAVVAGTIGVSNDDGASYYKIPEPKEPIPVIMFHGKEDPAIPYEGGQGPNLYVLSVADAVTFWVGADGCSGTPQTQTSADGNIIIEDYTACAAGTEVELVTIVNGGHQWPKLENPGGISATDAIWEFFSHYSK